MSKGFEMLRDYIEHDALCMRRRKCCDFEYELQQEFAALETENEKLRELVQQLYPYAKAFLQMGVLFGNNDTLSYEWELCLHELGIEV